MERIKIIPTTDHDLPLIVRVHRSAFNSNIEADLTFNLLKDDTATPVVSLLAFKNNVAIGHILFTKVEFKSRRKSPVMHLLAPLAVVSEYQNQGVGSMLIRAGIEKLRLLNTKLVFVLGHIDYYPQFGFIRDANRFGFKAPYPIPNEVADAWMVQELVDGAIENYKGEIACAISLDKEEYWRE